MGRGSHLVGKGCILGGQGLLCSEITNTVKFAASEFSRVTQTDRHSDQGTHPLIESLRQRLKKDYLLNMAKVIKEFYTHLLSSLDIGTVLYFGLSHFNDLMAHSCF